MRIRRRSADPATREDDRPSLVGRALRRFAVATVVALVVLALGTVLMSRRIAQEEAIRDARVLASGLAHGSVTTRLDARAREGNAEALARLDRVLRSRLGIGGIDHIKIWDRSGRVIWADDPDLVGRRYALPKRVADLFGTDRSVAEVSDSERPARGREPDTDHLLEVYAGSRSADGQPFVFETYTDRHRVAANTGIIFTELAPIGLLALLAFAVVTLPMAVSLARYVDRGQRHRAQLLRHTLTSWRYERRRLAQAIHDDVVQDLATVGYALPYLVHHLPPDPSADRAREAGRQLEALVVKASTSLRRLVVELFPADVGNGKLADALSDLAARTENDGVTVYLDVAEDMDLDREIAGVVYRVVQEGLRNVVKHAEAQTATVTVGRRGESVDVRVEDDGRGPGDEPVDTGQHVGLSLLADTLRELGGRIRVERGIDGGLVLSASLPARLAT